MVLRPLTLPGIHLLLPSKSTVPNRYSSRIYEAFPVPGFWARRLPPSKLKCTMSGSSRNSRIRPSTNLLPRGDYRDYVPILLTDARRPMNLRGSTRDRLSFLEERLIGGSNYGIGSFPSTNLLTPYLLMDDYNPTHFIARNNVPSLYNQVWTGEESSRLSQEEQKNAINKLRKQLYTPHLSNIVKRLSSIKSTSNNTKSALQNDDDDMKRCAICLEDFETKEFVMSTPCNHMYHEECIVPWVKSHGKCPVCRLVFTQ